MTPLVRYKNINVENLKKFLKMYPYIVDNETWETAFSRFDFSSIGNNYEGYRRTAYQFACQVGIENRGSNYFEVNNYLFMLSDEELCKYLQFWMLTYYAPNPYVNSNDAPKLIWVDICEKILQAPNYKIDFYQYFHDNINESIDINNPTNAGNPDTLKNALVKYGIFIEIEQNNRVVYIKEENIENVKEYINIINKKFPIPQNHMGKREFFNRFSFDNFSRIFIKNSNCKNYKNLEVDMGKKFEIHNLFFENKEVIERQINKAIKLGKNIILTGPPGTGKSKLAKQICDNYNVDYKMTTAISDWSTYETIGGYKMDKDSNLYFEEGVFLSCFKDKINEVKNEWLIIDEMNRADIDKAFGVFFSVLAGDDVNLNFKDNNNNAIEIINQKNVSDIFDTKSNQYIIPNDWRMIGTINTIDKTSLFDMSYALMRRFAFISISIPKQIDNEMLEKYLEIWEITNIEIGELHLSEWLAEIWRIINKYRKIGPALLKDIANYVEVEDDLLTAITIFVLPQFEGIDDNKVSKFAEELKLLPFSKNDSMIEVINDFFEEFLGIDLE